MIENVLASRYASPEMAELWSPTARVVLERRLWVEVLEAQRELGLEIPEEAVAAYREAAERVDLASIRRREQALRHDVKARLDEFNSLAGYQLIHLGMTSRDLTENVELIQIRTGLRLLVERSVAALARLAHLATEHGSLAVTARTHNVPAQLTTVGKRLATAGEELVAAVTRLEDLAAGMKLRGIKGPVGTQQDQAELLGSPEAAARLDARLATALGFAGVMGSVGQVYPRSLDLEVVAALVQLVSGPVNLTNTLRLMAGHELASEGFSPDQVGSSAMPHKMNARTSERVHGLKVVLGGYLAMALGLAGEQWNEGDVSCSVVRRVMIPDSFLAADGLFQSFLTILDELSFFPAAIEREVAAHLPFLSTTRLLTAAVAAGMGREEAHDLIRRHAVEAARERQRGGDGDLVARLVADQSFPLDSDAIRDLLQVSPPGRVAHQIAEFTATVAGLVERYPAAATYRPAPIV